MLHLSDEGYIKYQCFHLHGLPPDKELIAEINDIRSELWQLKLIGVDSNGTGYGNISTKPEKPVANCKFIISGTQTGQHPVLTAHHYATVTSYSIAENTVHCFGEVKASSEALTHAAIYEADAGCHAVIHVHHLPTWEYWLHKLPTTKVQIPYGTPDMAKELLRLFRQTNLPEIKVVVMAGHPEGLIAFGDNAAEAYSSLLSRIVQG